MASRFWVGGTGTWDSSSTTHWASSSGGASGQSVPGTSDTVTLDASSGGGTVTVNTTVTVQSITCGAFTGTLDFSANNNNVTLSATTGFNGSGSGTRTINLGNGTWTLSGTGAGTTWQMVTTTNLTFSANSSIISISGVTASTRTFQTGGLTYSTLTFPANSSGGAIFFGGTLTCATLNVTGPQCLAPNNGVTNVVTNALNWTGASGSEIFLCSGSLGATGTISSANNGTFTWAGFRDIAFTGGGTFSASSSFDLGHNSGITITAPSSGGGVVASRIQLGM